MLRRLTYGAAARQTTTRLLEAAHARLELATAVSREHLLQTHVAQALELAELGRDRLPLGRALEIYCRLHGLAPETEAVVRSRALATMGEEGLEDFGPYDDDDAPASQEDGHWLSTLLGERFRPRVQKELRSWIELHAGRAEAAVLETHVRNALRFVEILGDELSLAEAVDVYTETLALQPDAADAVRVFTLERLSRTHLPPSFWRGGADARLPGPSPLSLDDEGRAEQAAHLGARAGAREGALAGHSPQPLYQSRPA